MDVEEKDIEKKKEIGKLGNSKVFLLTTSGGWNMVVAANEGKQEILALAPHPAVGRYIAQKRCPDITYTELSKAEEIEPRHFAFCVDKYEKLTDVVKKKLK